MPVKLTYPTIDTLARRVSQIGLSCRLWKKDMVRAFRQIPLCPMDYSLIGYRWRNFLFFDKVMPMGLHSVAYVCQRITNSIVYIHRSFGYWSVNYLDDFGSAEHKDDAWNSFNLMTRIMQSIGAQEAPEKSVAPTTCMEFLGNMVDMQKMTLEVSEHHMIELAELLEVWNGKQKCNKKQMQSLIGKLSFVTNCVRGGRIFISRLIDCLKEFSDKEYRCIGQETKKDISWWQKFLPTFNGVSMLWPYDRMQPNSLLASDASLIGRGGTCGKEYCHFRFSENILLQTDNITQRELFTIMVVVKLWCKKLKGHRVHFFTDNEAAMYAINNGHTSDAFMMKCLHEIAWISANNGVLLKAVHISTKNNVIPDALSRWYINSESKRTFKCHTDNTWIRQSVSKQLMNFITDW